MKKTVFNHYIAIISLFAFLTLISCTKNTGTNSQVPTLSTKSVINIKQDSAESGGTISDDGGSAIISKGVCWSTSNSPTITGDKTIDGSGTRDFKSIISNLNPNTTYYVRAYAINTIGTGYGETITFKTLEQTIKTIPSLTTIDVSLISQTTAQSGGIIISDGGDSIIAKGICWDSTSDPVIGSRNTIDGSGIGNFTSNLKNLVPNTTYYVRAYATNSKGVAYGNLISFKTKQISIAPTVLTTAISSITQTSAQGGGNVTSDGGETVTNKGICWSTSSSPTIASNKTVDGSGIGTYTSLLNGLIPNTVYYVRAYATNIIGTAYGNVTNFVTKSIPVPLLTTSSISIITSSSASSGGSITSDGGLTITAKGVCWSTTTNPTIANNKTNDGPGTGAFVSSISSLTSGISYYVRAYATTAAGTGYGNQVNFTTLQSTNNFPSVVIGTQTWMLENLDVSTYQNGDIIPQVQDSATWASLSTGAWCYYQNSTVYGTVYGKLYNWYAVNDPRGLSPTGWHIPSYDEWSTLSNFLNGWNESGGKLKETGLNHWLTPNFGASNSSGFTGLPGGKRLYFGGYAYQTRYGYWWSSTATGTGTAQTLYLYTYDATFNTAAENVKAGLSIRCLKN